LCRDIITVPPLRQRISENSSELPLLLKKTINKITGEDSKEIYDMVYKTVVEKLGKNYPWPGNVRELEQCVRRILLTKNYNADLKNINQDLSSKITVAVESGNYDAQNLIADYCKLLYQRHGTYQDVARITKLDRRTVKRYIMME
jgi:transcriptional regulator with GAF, ATPase, and Fis domain